MAHHKSAKKRIRQSIKRNYYNRNIKKSIKFAIRDVREATEYTDALAKLSKVTSILDKASVKGIIHKNKASRRKARLSKFVKSLKESN